VAVDTTAWVVGYLSDQLTPTEVAGDSTGREQGQAWVDVRADPGGRELARGRLWTTPMSLRCYGATFDARRALCLAALAALGRAPGTVDDDLVVTRVDTLSTPYSDLDLLTGEHVVSCRVEVYCRTR
jgi:hypothetical protein